MSVRKISKRERDSVLSSLRAGVVPRLGLQFIQVGRVNEVKAIIKDLEKIQHSGSTIRMVVGDFGSGKTFFLTLANIIAHSMDIVTTKVDIALERTLYSRDGRGRATFCELMRNISIKSKPDGDALKVILENWLSNYIHLESTDRKSKIKGALTPLKECVDGFDFIEILNCYADAYNENNEERLDSCLKWLRGEFKNITSAKNELPSIKKIINDENYFDYLKLYSRFFGIAGFRGFLVCFDELANLTQQRSEVRKRNYETILKIINDTLQGNNGGLMFVFGGTPDFIFCDRKGLYSDGALKTRLARNEFQNEKYRDFSGPLIELSSLSVEEYFQLFKNIRDVFANGDQDAYLVSDTEIEFFLKEIYRQMGADVHMTARDAIKKFVNILNILEENPGSKFGDIFANEQRSNSANASGNVDL